MAGRGAPLWFQETDMLYKYVIDTVIQDCKEHFLDEGLSEDVVLDLKGTWEQHLEHSGVSHNFPAPHPIKAPKNSSLASVDDVSATERDSQVQSDDVPGANGGDEEITSADDEPGALDTDELLDTDNTLVCQYEKINHAKKKWKVFLKSGIMTVNEKDYVFQKCSGEAVW